MAGHHSAAFTLSTYVHLLDNDLPDADALEMGNTWATRPAETGRDAEAAEAAKTAI